MIETPEFSRKFRLDQISAAGSDHRLEANAAERDALARRFGILGIASLVAEIRVKAIAAGTMVRVKGRLTAEVTQACVVTLEPVEQKVDETFELTFREAVEEDDEDGEIEFSMEEDDPPDAIVNGMIDVGEAVAEHLALALDPFPRKAGARVPAAATAAAPVEEKPNPFAVLAALRQKKE
ncbi:MAG TPA: DUF177 domain-containing protein [Candidatus Omnitrophota bacterium]|nr:DUF177 domain-containing protein [Candidatus Omnitrophota bacterium]